MSLVQRVTFGIIGLVFAALALLAGLRSGESSHRLNAANTSTAQGFSPVAGEDPAKVWGVAQGQRIAVAQANPTGGTNALGYVDWNVMNAGVGQRPDIAPIYSTPTSSQIIGWWAPGYGWITTQQHDAPGFDVKALVAQQRAADAAQYAALHPGQ